VFVDGHVNELDENEMENIALSSLNACYFKIDSANLQSESFYEFAACVTIDNNQYCDDVLSEIMTNETNSDLIDRH